jgi:hypothetical protein
MRSQPFTTQCDRDSVFDSIDYFILYQNHPLPAAIKNRWPAGFYKKKLCYIIYRWRIYLIFKNIELIIFKNRLIMIMNRY